MLHGCSNAIESNLPGLLGRPGSAVSVEDVQVQVMVTELGHLHQVWQHPLHALDLQQGVR
jgi:hypothetical protein